MTSQVAHNFLRFAPHPPERPEVREIATVLLNRYTGKGWTRKQWKNAGRVQFSWWSRGSNESAAEQRTETSKPISLLDFEHHLASTNGFAPATFNVYDPACPWLDDEIQASINFHKTDADTGESFMLAIPTKLGTEFPILPRLDREGWITNSFQRRLATRALALRTRIVETSHEFQKDDWLEDLRAYAVECVSLIDITLHQLYSKAEWDPLPGWEFDRAKVGTQYSRRTTDKFKWVYQIAKRYLHAAPELRAFGELKTLRNHLQHFDPPCFACTLEEVTIWLNHLPKVGMLAYKIRRCIGSPPSAGLISLILAPSVVFAPLHAEGIRHPPRPGAGYAGILASAPSPPRPNPPTAILTAAEVLRMLELLDAIKCKKEDPSRKALTEIAVRLMADTMGIAAAEAEARKRGWTE